MMNFYCRKCACVFHSGGHADDMACLDCGSPEVISEIDAAKELVGHFLEKLPEKTRMRLLPSDAYAIALALLPCLDIQDAIVDGPLCVDKLAATG